MNCGDVSPNGNTDWLTILDAGLRQLSQACDSPMRSSGLAHHPRTMT